MSTLRAAAQQALEALEEYQSKGAPFLACDGAVAALRAALAQQEEPQTLDEALQQPRALAQAYEAGYKAAYEAGYKVGVAHEREACAQVCEARFMGDMTREDMEARRCAAAIRERNNP